MDLKGKNETLFLPSHNNSINNDLLFSKLIIMTTMYEHLGRLVKFFCSLIEMDMK